ncbi:YgjP-like metallopeptidase domain-containing protein [Candidatus Mesenet endosymbiont of Agriotes lineatus]|uniref:YgjP-like metallopeptidase domain-containing protein n=1 Tax=Candidatus Mesenet endosymbiont of Agriotes lineatus TaxID=3077948 RepID=UPI0030CCBEF1
MYIFHRKNIIHFSLFFSSNQKDLSIMIGHDIKTVIVIAPTKTSLTLIKHQIKKNSKFIVRKQKYLKSLLFNNTDFSDSKYAYFGKRYAAYRVKSCFEFVKLYRGVIYVYIKHPLNKKKVKALLNTWYKERAHIKLAQRLNDCLFNFNITQKAKLYHVNLKVLYLKNKFFYYDPQNYILLLNIALIKLPTFFVDYILYYALFTISNAAQSYCIAYQLLQNIMSKDAILMRN